MAITPAPGWMVDPNNPNGVIPIGSQASINNPNASLIATGQPAATASSGTITRTSSAPAPTPTYQPVPGTSNTVTPVQNNSSFSIANTPAPQSSAINWNSYAPTTGLVNPSSVGNVATGGANAGAPISNPTQTASTGTAPSSGGVDYAGLVKYLISNSILGSPTAAAAGSGLLASGTNNALTSSPAYQQYQKDTNALKTLQQGIGNRFQALETGDQALPVVLGQEGAIQKNIGAQEQALQTAIANDLASAGQSITEQGQQQAGLTSAGTLGVNAQQLLQQGLTSAGNLTYPITLSLGQYAVSPTGAGSVPGAGASNAYQNATNVAINQSNIDQGTNAAALASNIQGNLSNYGGILNQFQSFLTANNLNSQTIPAFNQPINKWIGTFQNPAAVSAVLTYGNELRNFAGSLIQSGVDITPTGTEGQTLMTDPTNLSVPQLLSLGQVLSNLGQQRYVQANQQAQDAFAAAKTAGNLYTGSSAQPQVQTPIIPSVNATQNLNSNNWLQLIGGAALNTFGGLGGAAGIGNGMLGAGLEQAAKSLFTMFL